jgi:ATP-binding cassette subfamily C protein
VTRPNIPPPDRPRTTVVAFARALWTRHPGATALSLALLVLSSLTEGIGLLIVIPMLSLAGIPLGGAMMDGVTARVASVLGALGVPLTLPVVLLVGVTLVAARAALVQAESVVAGRLGFRVAAEERDGLFAAVVAMPWSRFVALRGADVVQALTVHADGVMIAIRESQRLLADLLTIAVSLAIAFGLSWPITLLVIASGAVLLAVVRVARAPGRAEGERFADASGALFRAATDTVAAMKAVKGYAAERRTIAAFRATDHAMTDAMRRIDSARARSAAVLSVGMAVVLSGIVYLALTRVGLAPAALVLLLAMFARLIPRAAALYGAWQSLDETIVSWDIVRALRERCEREAAPLAPEPPAGAPALRPPAPALHAEGVAYQHGGQGAPALVDVTCMIPAGALTVVTGSSGAGKTTFLDLLTGLLAPTSGAITIDGAPLDAATSDRWRGAIGYVPQEILLIPGSVRANLQWAVPGASDEAIRTALTAAGAAFAATDLDREIGDAGVQLSGGERQRLALARALLRDPALLVLDEATSALDATHEQQVLATLRALTPARTVVMVSHREAVVRAADHVVRLEDGRVTR